MTVLNPAPIRQLSLHWDAEPRALAHHLAEWTTGSAVSAGIAELAVESIKGSHQVLGFLNPAKLGRNLGYATKPVQNARRYYARQIEGGWLASGHAPLEDGRLVPVTFKPDKCRLDEKGDPIKYLRPAGSTPVAYFTPLDAAAYETIAERAGLTPPPFVSSWSAWLWFLKQGVEVCFDEGEKKAAAACSHGWLTIGLAGIWNGAPRPKDASGQPFGAPTLVAELQWLRSVRPAGAPLTIAFDASEKPRGRIAIRKARRLLGRLLTEQGHKVRIREMVQPDGAAFVKGTDDLLVHGGAAALAALPVQPFDDWLKASSEQALTEHLLHPFKTKHRKHRIIDRHFAATDLPATSPLVALIGGLGTNKTGAMAAMPRQSQEQLRQVVSAACDGACKGNPGPGGSGAVVCFADGSRLELGSYASETTNNRMELQAAIEVLQVLADQDLADGLVIETDSKYVCNGFEQWLANWKRNGWRTSTGEPVKNADLWQQLDALRLEGVRLKWVKGHAGHELNERCDQIASAFAAGETPRLRKPKPLAASTDRLVSITHRRSLADNQGHRFGLAVKREGKLLHALEQSQADLRQVEHLLAEHDGFVTVADSSYIGGSGEITPDQCAGAVLFIDEADAFLRHCLTAATAIKAHRCEVLTNLAACVAAARQVVLAGAHIDETTLLAFEAMRGDGAKAHIIESTLLAAAGRDVVMHRTAEQLLQELRNLATHRKPFLFHTGSKETSSRFAPANVAKLVHRWWPDARVLEMTSATIREPDHPAAAAVEDPQRLLDFDVVIATPVLETGFSIEDPHQHFAAVLGHTAGHLLPHAFVQSLGRLRSSVPRHIWCNHNGTKIGNGAPVAEELEAAKLQHATAIVHLVNAGEATGDAGRFVRWWAELAADQNWLWPHYRDAVATLLGREGYAVQRLDQQAADTSTELVDLLAEDRDANVAEETAAVAAAPAPDANQLELLESRQRLTADQRHQLERGRIERDLGIAKPTANQVEISRNGAYVKALQHLLTIDTDQRQRWQNETKAAMPASVRTFAPDFAKAMAPATRGTLLAQMPWLLELLDLAGTGKTIVMADFEQHHDKAKATANWREVFGFDPNGQCRTFVANLLALLGFKLQRTSRRELIGERRYWHYEVVDELAVLDRKQVLQRLTCGHFLCK